VAANLVQVGGEVGRSGAARLRRLAQALDQLVIACHSESLGSGGQREGDACAATGLVLLPEAAALVLDEPARDRKPEPGAVRALGAEARPRVLDRDADFVGERTHP